MSTCMSYHYQDKALLKYNSPSHRISSLKQKLNFSILFCQSYTISTYRLHHSHTKKRTMMCCLVFD